MASNRLMAVANVLTLLVGTAAHVVFGYLEPRTKRAVHYFLVRLAISLQFAWYFLGLGVSAFCLASQEGAIAIWVPLVFFAPTFLLMGALLERRMTKWEWRIQTLSKRIDLDTATFRPGVDAYSHAKTKPPLWLRSSPWSLPVGSGFLAAFVVSRAGASLDLKCVLAGAAAGVAALIFAGVSWFLISLLVRIVRWERTTGRKMLVALERLVPEP